MIIRFIQSIVFFNNYWEQCKLSNLIIRNDERNKNLEFTNVESVSNKTGFIKQTEQFEDYSVASADLSNYFIIRERQFAYNPSRINVGSIAYKEEGSKIGVVSPLYISFSTKSNVDDKFIWYWLKTSLFEAQRQTLSEGGVRDTLSFDKISQMKISNPNIIEQQKIGSIMNRLDRIITLHQYEFFIKAYCSLDFAIFSRAIPRRRQIA